MGEPAHFGVRGASDTEAGVVLWRFSGPTSFELIGQSVTVVFGVPGSYQATAFASGGQGEFPLGHHYLTVTGEPVSLIPQVFDVVSTGSASQPQAGGPELTLASTAVPQQYQSEEPRQSVGTPTGGTSTPVPAVQAAAEIPGLAPQLSSFALTDLGAGDLDGDRKADLVLVEANRKEIVLLRGMGDGTFSRIGWVNPGFTPDRVLVADFGGSALADVVVISWLLRKAVIYVSRGPFAFEDPTVVGLPEGATEVWSDRLDGDARSELVWVAPEKSVVWSFTAAGRVDEWTNVPDHVASHKLPPAPFVWVDFGGGEATELVYYSQNPGKLVLVRDGFRMEIGTTPGHVAFIQLVAADVDGDGRVELLGLDGAGKVHVLMLKEP